MLDSLNARLPKRLIRRPTLSVSRTHIACLLSMLRGERGASNTLVRVGSLLDRDLLVGRLAGAAADGDEPEEARSQAKGDGEPDDGEHLLAHPSVDVVGFEDGVEEAGEGGVDCCGGGCGGDDEDCLGLDMIQLACISNSNKNKGKNLQSKQ